MILKTGLLTLMLTLSLMFSAPAAQAVEFAAKLEQTNGGEVTQGAVLVSGVKFRLDILNQAGLITTISRPDLDLVWVINIGDQSYIEVKGVRLGPTAGEAATKELEKVADKKELGQEKISDFECTKIQYTYRDKRRGKVIQWVADKLNYPIKTVQETARGQVTSLFKEIKITEVDPVMFEVPKNFRKLEPPQKQQIQ